MPPKEHPVSEPEGRTAPGPYCPCCHNFDYHGPACPISNGMLSGQPIEE